MLSVYRTTSNQYPDHVYYNGSTSSSTNIQTKASVEALISASAGVTTGWTSFLNASTLQDPPFSGSLQTVKYRVIGDYQVDVWIKVTQGGSGINNTSIHPGTIPSLYTPPVNVAFSVATASGDSYQAPINGVVRSDGSVWLYTQKPDGTKVGATVYSARFSYPLGS